MLRAHAYLSSSPSVFPCVTLPALPKVHSDSEGGPLNLPQSLVNMLVMLNFFFLFLQQYILICAHHRPLQHTLLQYVGLDVHVTNMPQLQTRWSTLTKKLRSWAVPFVFSCQAPCQASFRPLPWASSVAFIYLFSRLPFGLSTFWHPYWLRRIQIDSYYVPFRSLHPPVRSCQHVKIPLQHFLGSSRFLINSDKS